MLMNDIYAEFTYSIKRNGAWVVNKTWNSWYATEDDAHYWHAEYLKIHRNQDGPENKLTMELFKAMPGKTCHLYT